MPADIRLLVIDPQVDFCDGPANGNLAVPGAWDDMSRLAAMVDRLGPRISDVDLTLDSHHHVDIAHPIWWMDRNGKSPAPFTLITAADVEGGVWTTRNPSARKRSLEYVRRLEKNGKYMLFIWPYHCEIGTPGHAVHPELFGALRRWTEHGNLATVNFVTKGSNPWTEHYSAVAAEVPDPEDPTTMINARLIDSLKKADTILIAGEALSHCVKSTVTDIADEIGADHVRKFVLLTDCTSSVAAVPGADFPAMGQAFIKDMQARGMKLSTSVDFLA